MADTRRAALYLVPPPAVRLASPGAGASRAGTSGSRVRPRLRPLLRATSRAVLRLADFTNRLGI